MDHADVHAWLDDAFFRPGALRRLDEGEIGPADAQALAVRDHLDACPDCTAELRWLRATAVALDASLGPAPAAGERMLARVRLVGRQRGAEQPLLTAEQPLPTDERRVTTGRRWATWQPAAIGALVLLVFAAGALAGTLWPSAEEPAGGPQLAHTAAVMGELLAMPDVREVRLQGDAGEPAGLVVHSPAKQWLAVLSSNLSEPASGRYECYLERDGESTFLGPMHFEGGTAFWAGPVTGVPDLGRPGDRFMVMQPTDAAPALWAQF